jgi:hypothetical protein
VGHGRVLEDGLHEVRRELRVGLEERLHVPVQAAQGLRALVEDLRGDGRALTSLLLDVLFTLRGRHGLHLGGQRVDWHGGHRLAFLLRVDEVPIFVAIVG